MSDFNPLKIDISDRLDKSNSQKTFLKKKQSIEENKREFLRNLERKKLVED